MLFIISIILILITYCGLYFELVLILHCFLAAYLLIHFIEVEKKHICFLLYSTFYRVYIYRLELGQNMCQYSFWFCVPQQMAVIFFLNWQVDTSILLKNDVGKMQRMHMKRQKLATLVGRSL